MIASPQNGLPRKVLVSSFRILLESSRGYRWCAVVVAMASGSVGGKVPRWMGFVGIVYMRDTRGSLGELGGCWWIRDLLLAVGDARRR